VESHLIERVRQNNPWLFGGEPVGASPPSRQPEPWIDRRQVELGRLCEPGKAHLVIGPRQAGKSSLLWSLLRSRQRPLYLNMEEVALRSWCDSPSAFMAELAALGPAVDAVFLEEVQWLDNAAVFIKGLVDRRPNFPILVTGSSSFHLLDRTRESLAGRATRHLLLPLSLAEVSPVDWSAPAVADSERRRAVKRQLRLGGYPEVWTGTAPERTLGDLVQAFVLRDASDLFSVERLDAYHDVMRLAARQVGNLINLSEYATITSISVNTVAKYLELLEQAHVLRRLAPFAGGKRREMTGARKVFFLDNGLRNAVLGRLSNPVEDAIDLGPLVENWVLAELAKALPWMQSIRHWRTLGGAEVDFVIEAPGGLLGIEVKASPLVRLALSRSSRSFIDAYAPQQFWVLNDELEAEARHRNTRARWLPLVRLPEALGDWMTEVGLA